MDKQKRILVLSKVDDRPSRDNVSTMRKMLSTSRHNIEYTVCAIEDVNFLFDGYNLQVIETNSGTDIKDFDGIFLMGWFKNGDRQDIALSMGVYMRAHGKKVLNSEVFINRSRGKLSQYVMAVLEEIPCVPFAMARKVSDVEDFIDKNKLEYPIIVKAAIASKGEHNYLVSNLQELREAHRSMPQQFAIVQKFVPNEGDFRLLVMGGEVKLVIHRRSQPDSHLNNTSQGGSAELVDMATINQKVITDSIKSSRMLNREVTGVDMIIDRNTGQHYFLETNNMPQLSTGSFVSEKTRILDDFFSGWIN